MKNSRLTAYGAADQRTPNSTTLKFNLSRDVRLGILADRGNLWALVATMILIISQVSVIGYYFAKLPPQIPIFYSTTWGEAMMSKNIFIVLLPVTAIFFVFLNIILYFAFFRDNKQGLSENRQSFSANRFLTRVLFASCVIVGFCTFWGAVKIVTLLA